ncbi:hypothetical protein NECID01_1927, partial [Nematocida sp. AWRm77]
MKKHQASSLLGKEVTVQCVDSCVIEGVLDNLDGYLNVTVTTKKGKCFVRGSSIV